MNQKLRIGIIGHGFVGKATYYIMTHLEHGLKLKILDLYDDGRYTQKALANRFKITDRTIKRWIQNKKNNEIYQEKSVNMNHIR